MQTQCNVLMLLVACCRQRCLPVSSHYKPIALFDMSLHACLSGEGTKITISSVLVFDLLDSAAFNQDAAKQSALRASLVVALPSVVSGDSVTDLRAIGSAGYVSASVGQPTTVSFNIMFKASALGDCMSANQCNTRASDTVVSELVQAVSSNNLAAALATPYDFNVKPAASITAIQRATVVVPPA